MPQRWSHVIGFDDGAFEREHRGEVLLVGAVFAETRLEGVLSATVTRDGSDATETIVGLVDNSRFASHLHAIFLQGVAVAGFNVIDLNYLHRKLGVAVVAVARKRPNYYAIKQALLQNVSGGEHKWRLIEQLGPMEPVAGVYVQRAGIELGELDTLLQRLAVNSVLPEPLRVAHLIASGVSRGESRQRA